MNKKKEKEQSAKLVSNITLESTQVFYEDILRSNCYLHHNIACTMLKCLIRGKRMLHIYLNKIVPYLLCITSQFCLWHFSKI